MKKYATVPFRCKLKRFWRAVGESGIRLKIKDEVGFSRKKDIVPDSSFTVGFDFFISVKTMLCGIAVIFAAALSALLAFRLVFSIAVYKKTHR